MVATTVHQVASGPLQARFNAARAASGPAATMPAWRRPRPVRPRPGPRCLFTGPFDLLLALVLRDEVELVEVPVAAPSDLTYVERLAAVEDELDLTGGLRVPGAGGLAARAEGPPAGGLRGARTSRSFDPFEDAAAQLADRLAEYQRLQAGRRLARRAPGRARPPRVPKRPRRSPRRAPAERRCRGGSAAPGRRHGAAAGAAGRGRHRAPAEAPAAGAQLPRPLPRAARRARTFTFDDAVDGLDRMGVAVAFWALLELYKRGEVRMASPSRSRPSASPARRG